MVTFIKVGGSLLNYPVKLKKLCYVLSEASKKHQIVLVPGGGIFADAVRIVYKAFNLSEERSHFMAILGMEQYGYLLHDLCEENSVLEQDPVKAVNLAKKGRLPIFLPYRWLLTDTRIEQSWMVTSDTITAHLAFNSGSRRLILAKDVDGLFIPDHKENRSKVLTDITIEKLASLNIGGVDKAFPHYLLERNVDTYVANGLKPQRIIGILEGKEEICTHIITLETRKP